MISELSLSLLSHRTVNIVTHSYDTSDVFPKFLLAKDRPNRGYPFQVSTNFLPYFFSKVHIQTSGWTEVFKAIAQKIFDIRLRLNPLNLPFHFSFDILIFLPIHYCAVVKTLNKLHEHEFL